MSRYKYDNEEQRYDVFIKFKNNTIFSKTYCDYIELIPIERILFITKGLNHYHIKYDDILYYEVNIIGDSYE